MEGRFDGNQAFLFLLFWLPWVLAVRELIRGARSGEMMAYGRGRDGEGSGTELVSFHKQRVMFCFLLVLYLAIAAVVPAVTANMAIERGGFFELFQWKPKPPPPENLPN